MAGHKKRDTRITVAVIAAIGVIIGGYYEGYYGGPLAALQYKERSIVDVSLGNLGTTIDEPKSTLSQDSANEYYVDIVTRNRGSSDGVVNLTIQGTNVKIWDSNSKTWAYTQSGAFRIFGGNTTMQYIKTFIMPDAGINSFSLQLSATAPTNTDEPFANINLLTPTILTYQKSGNNFVLVQ